MSEAGEVHGVTADRMTEEEARERLAEIIDPTDYDCWATAAVVRILATLDALAVLVPPAEMLAAYERAGRMEPTGDRSLIVRGRRCDLAHWRIVPEEAHGDG